MSKNFDIEKLTVKQICNYIAIVNKLVDEKLIKFNPNKAAVIFNHDKASIFLEKQNVELQKRIDKAIEVINKMISPGYYKDGTSYMATSKNSEFGTRAKVILEILIGEDNE